MDLANVALVAVLAGRIGRSPRDSAPFAYALYLPAISHAQFVTSEMPALLLVLSALVVVTSPRSTHRGGPAARVRSLALYTGAGQPAAAAGDAAGGGVLADLAADLGQADR